MPISRTVAALVGCVAIAACASQGAVPTGGAPPSSGEARWTVGPALAGCVAVAPTWCLQVRTVPGGPWTHHYGPIEGFRFVPGDEVDLVVRHEPIARPPADAPNRRTVMVRELERRTLPGTPLSAPLAGSAWRLVDLPGWTAVGGAREAITMAFDAAGRVAGSAGVNRYSASAAAGPGWIRVAAGITTRMAGPPEAMQLESEFLARLQRAGTWHVDGDRLRLLDGAGGPLMTLRREPAGSGS
jgi:heat shock protein HslJ